MWVSQCLLGIQDVAIWIGGQHLCNSRAYFNASLKSLSRSLGGLSAGGGEKTIDVGINMKTTILSSNPVTFFKVVKSWQSTSWVASLMPLVDKPTLCDASEPTPNFLKPSLTTAKQQLQGSYPVVKFHGAIAWEAWPPMLLMNACISALATSGAASSGVLRKNSMPLLRIQGLMGRHPRCENSEVSQMRKRMCKRVGPRWM